MKKVFLFFLLILIPNSFAVNDTLLDCEFVFDANLATSIYNFLVDEGSIASSVLPENEFLDFQNQEKLTLCKKIINETSLTQTEKKVLIAQTYNIDARDFEFGLIDKYHERLIEDRDQYIPFGNEVDGISKIITNAGYKFVTINPSVKLEDTIYIPQESVGIRNFHFTVNVPEDYEANDYPDNLNGYCRIEYEDPEVELKEDIFFNSEHVVVAEDHDDLDVEEPGNYSFGAQTEFETQLTDGEITVNGNLEIESSYEREVYKWDKYCCQSGEHGCTKYCYDCDYENTEYFQDKVLITDNYYATLFEPQIQEDYEIWSEGGILHLKIYIQNSSKYKRVMIDRFLDMTNYYSAIRYKFEPLDYLYFEAIGDKNETKYNRATKQNETVLYQSEQYDYKSPFIEITDEYIYFAFRDLRNKVRVRLETLFANILDEDEGGFVDYEIDLTVKQQFKNILIKENQVFYFDNETIEVTPYLITEDGIYMDDFEIRYETDNDEIFSKFTSTNETISFDYKGQGWLILAYDGDDKYYKTIHKKRVVRRPYLLRFLVNLWDYI